MPSALHIADLRERAKRRLPRLVFDYLDGAAEDETTLAANTAAFAEHSLLPRYLCDVSQRSSAIELLGQRWAQPFGIAPIGMAGLFWPGGDIAAAKAAAKAQVPYVLSTAASSTLEDVIAANPAAWFQLYVLNQALAEHLLARALKAGYQTLVVTVDVPLSGLRERDARNGLSQPLKLSPAALASMLARPRWLAGILRHGQPDMANLRSADASDAALQAALLQRQMDASFNWERLQAIRQRWPHRLLVKGLLSPLDVAQAFDLGADAVIVSNHGGRQLNGAPASLACLPAAVAAAGGKPVLLDGGIRRGGDVIKALALGASAVLLGRAPMYGLASAGEAGVTQALQLLARQLDTSLALLGCSRIEQVQAGHLLPADSLRMLAA